VDLQTSRARISRGSRKEKPPPWSLWKTVARVNFLRVFLCVWSSFLTEATNSVSEKGKRWHSLQFYGLCRAFFASEMRWVWLSSVTVDRYGLSDVFWSLWARDISFSHWASFAWKGMKLCVTDGVSFAFVATDSDRSS